MKRNYIIIISIIAFMFSSCEKENLTLLDAQKWLTFENSGALVNILNKLDNGESITTIFNGKHFLSMWDVYQEILNSDSLKQKELIKKYPLILKYDEANGYNSLILNISDQTLAKILSPEGFIKLDNKIIRREGDIIKVITNGDEKLIPLLSTISSTGENPNIRVEKIIKHISTGICESPKSQLRGYFFYSEGYEYAYSLVRCHWELFADYDPVFDYSIEGAEITNQEKKWLGWLSYSKPMSLHFHSACMYCERYSYDEENLLSPGGVNLYASGTEKSLRVSKRINGTGPISVVQAEMDFQIYGNSYYHNFAD